MKTMIADSKRKFILAVTLLASCALMASLASAQSARISSEIVSTEQSTLKNSQNPLAQAQYDAGRVPANTRLDGITIVFSRSAAQEADLKALIAAQQNPASPQYHQWLNPDQFAARFGMADADLAKVEGWLQQQGFAIDDVARSKNAIHFAGTVRQVEQAFSTEMHYYNLSGTKHFAPSTALSVPSALAPTVLAIKNLDDFRPKSHAVFGKNARVKPAFTSSQTGEVFFAPPDIKTVYDINPLYNAGITGTGQAIALVGQSEIQLSDIEAFQNAAGLTVKDPTQVLVPNTGDAAINPVSTGDEAESDLDIEWSGAIAPGATIQFVFTGNSSNSGGAFQSIQYAIDQDLAPIISSSYGDCEADLGGQTLETFFEQAATQGQTVMAAAGDDGSTDCFGDTDLTTAQQEALGVDYPGSSPNVTSMGGTEISATADNGDYLTAGDGYWSAPGSSDTVSTALQYIPEIAWNDDAANCGQSDCLSSGGGGASSLFTKPSWQTGVPGIPADGKRDVPDLALYASPSNPGYLFCSSDPETGITGSCANGFRDANSEYLTIAGGTSFDAPIFSGILALINQNSGYTEGQGLINPTLYTLASNSATYAAAFHDITTGNNDCTAGSADCSGAIGFSAGTGYDQVTGLGSVDAASLAAAWPANTGVSAALIDTTTAIAASSAAPNTNVSDTFTITVASATGTTIPTGNVSIEVDGGTAITEALASNGTYVYTTSFATAGSHTIFAAYAGDATHVPSSSSVSVTVAAVSSGKGTFAVAPTPSTLTVAQGASGSETITVTPSASPAYTGTVDMSFVTSNSSALQNLCYQWSDQNTAGDGVVAISGTTAGTIQLTLDANAADCTSTGAIRNGGKPSMRRLGATSSSAKNTNGGNPIPMTVAFAGLLLAGFLGRSRKLRGLAAMILLAAAGLAVTACGGSVSTTVSDPPKGNYTITVTGTDSTTSTITNTATFTLTIN
ncbi:MAG: protease pro-enzyme activation domain-containing protein [Terracidiphilus sp.]